MNNSRYRIELMRDGVEDPILILYANTRTEVDMMTLMLSRMYHVPHHCEVVDQESDV